MQNKTVKFLALSNLFALIINLTPFLLLVIYEYAVDLYVFLKHGSLLVLAQTPYLSLIIVMLLIFWFISSITYFYFSGKYCKKNSPKYLSITTQYVPLIIIETIHFVFFFLLSNRNIYFHVYWQEYIIFAVVMLPFQWIAYSIRVKGYKTVLPYIGIVISPVIKLLPLLVTL